MSDINEILKNDYDLCCKDLKKATKKIEKQDKEIERLNNIINKAKEYIEKYGKTIEEIAYQNGTCEDSLQEILDILKGE